MSELQTILMVDDSPSNLYLMRAAFKIAKCSNPLQEARDGEEAIAYLNGDGRFGERGKFPLPTVMLLDLNMPKKNGFDVLRWVRAQPGLKRLRIVMLTASVRTEDVERAYDLGANSFLVKPIGLETLAMMMRRLVDWIEINEFVSLHETQEVRSDYPGAGNLTADSGPSRWSALLPP
jgi:CheY-like chemotaxis protein